MEASKKQMKLLEKRSEILLKLANLGMIVEENTFYTITTLKAEVKSLTALLKKLQNEQS